jgi:hypothetical protein
VKDYAAVAYGDEGAMKLADAAENCVNRLADRPTIASVE